MSLLRRFGALLAALTLTAGLTLALTARPAHAATGISGTPTIAGFCNALQAGEIKKSTNGSFYKCSYVRGLGWVWLKITVIFPGCSPARAGRLPAC